MQQERRRRTGDLAACVLLAVLLAAPAWAGDDALTAEIVSEEVGVWNAEGKYLGLVPQKDFSKGELSVIDLNRSAVLLENKNGEPVWVDRIDVSLSQTGSVDEPCKKLSIAGSPDRKNTSTMGVASACEGSR